MRHYPSGQSAHIRVIRRRSRPVAAWPLALGILFTFGPPPGPRAAPHRWARRALLRAGRRNRREDPH